MTRLTIWAMDAVDLTVATIIACIGIGLAAAIYLISRNK